MNAKTIDGLIMKKEEGLVMIKVERLVMIKIERLVMIKIERLVMIKIERLVMIKIERLVMIKIERLIMLIPEARNLDLSSLIMDTVEEVIERNMDLEIIDSVIDMIETDPHYISLLVQMDIQREIILGHHPLEGIGMKIGQVYGGGITPDHQEVIKL
jgi:hypothetical protein